ncbi:MAG: PaaI family thioesterase [Myxococcota bacterium]
MDPAALMTFGREVLASQPFSALLGTTLDVFVPGRAELVLPVRPELLQQHGFVHGGVLAYLADNATTFAGGSILGDAVTIDVTVNYVRPATGMARLRAVATVVHAGRTTAVCRCDVLGEPEAGEPTLCAVAQGTIRKVSR